MVLVLKELRKIYRITMQELADSISVSKQLIGQIEKGNRVITDDVLNKLVEYFGLNKQLTKDYRAFLTKEAMDQIEIHKINLKKIEKEAEDIEYEDTDYETGETYISHHSTMDETGYIIEKYELSKAEFAKKFQDRLGSIIDKSMEDQEENNGYVSVEYAISLADEKISFYDKLLNLDIKADPYIFQKIIRALSVATSGGLESDSFTRKLVKLISAELEKKKKEQEKNYKLWQEVCGEDSN